MAVVINSNSAISSIRQRRNTWDSSQNQYTMAPAHINVQTRHSTEISDITGETSSTHLFQEPPRLPELSNTRRSCSIIDQRPDSVHLQMSVSEEEKARQRRIRRRMRWKRLKRRIVRIIRELARNFCGKKGMPQKSSKQRPTASSKHHRYNRDQTHSRCYC